MRAKQWCARVCIHEERVAGTLAATLLGVLIRADAPPAVDAGGTPGELGAPSNGSSETVAEQLEAQQAAAASAAARASQAYDRRVQVRGMQSLRFCTVDRRLRRSRAPRWRTTGGCRCAAGRACGAGIMKSAGRTHAQACQ